MKKQRLEELVKILDGMRDVIRLDISQEQDNALCDAINYIALEIENRP